VRRGKPYPDLFLFAAHSMGFDSAQTLVVEDSTAGVTAALRAKMEVLRYGAPQGAEQPEVTSFTDMEQLPRLIQELLSPLGG
jgi:beta-phosphoglucomutase-like phosphatase (HAD superfamily)